MRTLETLRELKELVVARAKEADQWQPIETAPKDSSRVMLWSSECNAPFSGQYYGDLWRYDYQVAPFKYQPTHWRPLPHPPLKMGVTGEKYAEMIAERAKQDGQDETVWKVRSAGIVFAINALEEMGLITAERVDIWARNEAIKNTKWDTSQYIVPELPKFDEYICAKCGGIGVISHRYDDEFCDCAIGRKKQTEAFENSPTE